MNDTQTRDTPEQDPEALAAAMAAAPYIPLVCSFCGLQEQEALLMVIPVDGSRVPCICDRCVEGGQQQLNGALRKRKAAELEEQRLAAEVERRIAQREAGQKGYQQQRLSAEIERRIAERREKGYQPTGEPIGAPI